MKRQDIYDLKNELDTLSFSERHVHLVAFVEKHLMCDYRNTAIRLSTLQDHLSRQYFYELIWAMGGVNFDLGYERGVRNN